MSSPEAKLGGVALFKAAGKTAMLSNVAKFPSPYSRLPQWQDTEIDLISAPLLQ